MGGERDDDARWIYQALSRSETYPSRPVPVEVRETHISWVFLAGERAYKLKKRLVLDFVDYGTPERRRAMCREEVRLNRRLAADVYLGVRGVARTTDGVELIAEDDPRAIDYLVEMRRYDERRTLATLLQRGELDGRQLAAVGERLARFHAQAPVVTLSEPAAVAAERRFVRNAHELLARQAPPGDAGRVHALQRFAGDFLDGHARVVNERARVGRIREGHGDLRAEHVLLDEHVRIVDCVEFDRSLRELDVSDDLAFLVFDLVARGGDHLAGLLVRAYREAGGDPGDDALIAFHAVYWALVRAKVALVRAAELLPANHAGQAEMRHAHDLLAVAERLAWRARMPIVVAVCGVPASGKTRLARALAVQSGLPQLSSDRVRKQMQGRRATDRGRDESYSDEWNRRTYAELGRRAADQMRTHRGVIVDATFRHRIDRQAFASGLTIPTRILFVECQVPRSVLIDRARRRERDRDQISDADAAVVLREQNSFEPLDELAADAHLVLRADRPVEEIRDEVVALLDRRLPRLGCAHAWLSPAELRDPPGGGAAVSA